VLKLGLSRRVIGLSYVYRLLDEGSGRRRRLSAVNPLIPTLKPQSNGPCNYNNIVIGTLTVYGWAVTFGTARRGLAQSPFRYIKCNSPSINGQCTNFILFDVGLYVYLESKGLRLILILLILLLLFAMA